MKVNLFYFSYLEDSVMALDFTDEVTKIHGAKILRGLVESINRVLIKSSEYKLSAVIVKKLKVIKSLSAPHLK